MEEQSKGLKDYLDVLHRRRTPIAITIVICFVVGVAVAFALPPVYRSTATILIEEQEIPKDLVRSTITSYATQRIHIISKRVMSRANLMEIIDRFHLYADDRTRKTTEEILERMRNDITLTTIDADVIDPRSGRPTKATIAFSLSFDGATPSEAQKVANELTSLYLKENLKTRKEAAADTYAFLTDEANKLSEQIAQYESQLAEFKEKHMDSLPEMAELNRRLIDRAEQELIETRNQISAREDRKYYFESQLAQLNPFSPMYSDSGERIMDPISRLKMLRSALASASAKYAPDHPDVIRLQQEIAGLAAHTGVVDDSVERAKELAKARDELAAAKDKYANDHPDVIRLEEKVRSLAASLRNAKNKKAERNIGDENPENPAYINAQAQIAVADSEIKALRERQADLEKRLADYESRLASSPDVERGYRKLLRDYQNATARYQEIKAKQMSAEIAQQLEVERKGEKFSLVDPPQLPEKPVKPNRPVIVLLGFVLSMVSGVGYAAVAEGVDGSVRGVRVVTAMLHAPPLSIIPYMENSEDVSRRENIKARVLTVVVVGLILAVLLVLFFAPPLDVLWFKGLRRLDMIVGG